MNKAINEAANHMALIKDYEKSEYRKAFKDGSEKAWKNYMENIEKAVKKLKKDTGIEIDIDALIA